MYSKLDICNRALRMIGENRITSLEENNRIAEECKFLYPMVKREVIEKYPWKCAQKAIILRNLYINDSEELKEYGNKFLLPFDCIRVLAVDGDNFFHRDGLYLYAPSNSIKIIYSADIEEKYMTVRLVKILALQLAAELCKALSGDEIIIDNINKKLLIEQKQLTQLDSQEGEIKPISIHFNEAYSWIEARE